MTRQRRTDCKNQQWNAGHIKSLILYPFFLNEGFGAETQSPTFDLAGFKACWRTYFDVILSVWIRRYPGTRPRAFWEIDAPEKRRCTNGQHPFDDPRRKAAIPNAPRLAQLYYGKPQILKYESDFAAEYETQFAYLSRLDLLMPGEKEAVESGGILDDITRPGKDVVREILEACGPEFTQ